MAFQKLERSSQTPPGWRLATVEEAKHNLERIKNYNLIEEWDRVRLLDGWIGGSGYGDPLNVEVGFRSCLGYMLVVESPTPEISDAEDDRYASLYSKVPKLSQEGMNAAVLLCSEDSNEEALYWLMGGKTEGNGTREASEVVSAMARKWQGVHAKSREPVRTEDCLEDFQESLRGLLQDTEKSLRALVINNQNSEQGYIIDVILEEISSAINGNDQVFKAFGQEVVAETVWYFAVEKMAWQTFNILSRNLYGKLVMHSDPSLRNMILYANDFIVVALPEVWKGVEAAAKEANGDFKRFPMFDCKGMQLNFRLEIVTPDVLSTCLLMAAYDAWKAEYNDLSLVKRLIERDVKPSAKNNSDGNTVLHYVTKMKKDSDRYEIAKKLLGKDESSANAVGQEGTPLHIAARNGDLEMCRLLLNHNASLTIQDSSGYTPLHHAIGTSHYEVVSLLISEGGGIFLLDIMDNDGSTPLDWEVERRYTPGLTYEAVNRALLLLSNSSQPEDYFAKLQYPLSTYLRESSRMGYLRLVQKLLDGGADPFEGDDDGKTALHHAAECEDEDVAWEIIRRLLYAKKQGTINWEKASAGDKYGRNVLHVVAFLGRKSFCRKLLVNNINLINTKDRDGQSAIHYAVAGLHNDASVLYELFLREQDRNQVFVKDFSQRTPLHVAAARGNVYMLEAILQCISEERKRNYVRATDVLGQTALHKAASGGHVEVVKKLLKRGLAHPLKERDCNGKTALHFAAEADGEDAVEIAELLLGKCESVKHKSLLLLASPVGKVLPNPLLDEYLKVENRKIEKTPRTEEDLLRVAATLGDIDMTLESVSRGAHISLIRDKEWRNALSTTEEKNVQYVLKQVESIVEQGTDKPALEDNLGRSPFAIGLAALFLNPFVKSPITVGISGEWGMGKSSVMLQTESNLLKAAARLPFRKGVGKSNLSVIGQAKHKKISNAIKRLDAKVTNLWNFPRLHKFWKALQALWNKPAPSTENSNKIISKFLENYQPKHHQIFKCLAIMDRSDMFEEEKESGRRNERVGKMLWEEDLLQGTIPSILTVRYNAWHYRNETEAWAGLVVEITKELEATMTVAHKLRTSWIYNWRNHRNTICFKVILPFFLALVVAIFVSIILWLVFSTTHNKYIKILKYGGVPASVIVAAWGLGKSVISFVKPISSHVVDFICLPDHSQKLGYHQQVIDDINFLKEHLYYKYSRKWEVFSFIWCWVTWRWNENYVGETKIPKMHPSSGNNLRMIVFVDDLDRCEENVILQILSAVNLVLAICEINVILSMENSMIQRAIKSKYGNNNSNANNRSNEELAEKYLRKIVQLPLPLPDPSDSESKEFLERQLGMGDSIQGSAKPATETKNRTAHGHRKVSPKFDIVIATPYKFKQDTNTEIDSDAAQQGLGQTEESEKTTESEGSGVKNEIQETTDNEQTQDGSGVGERAIDVDQTPDNEEPNENEDRGFMDDLSKIINAMLIPKYTPGERSAFRFLHSRCTRCRKLPREWKCFMAYHRLAWNILYLIFHQEDVNRVEGWQVQIIAWIFVCWEWRNLITVLVKDWNKLEVLRNWEGEEGPSLREIVEHYIDEKWPAEKKTATKKEDDSTKKEDDYKKEDDSTKMEDDAIDSSSPEELEKISVSREEDTEGDDYLRNVLKEQKEMKEALRKAQEDMKEVLRKAQEDMKEAIRKAQEDMMEVLRKVQEDIREVLKVKEEMRDTLKMVKKNVFKDEEDYKGESSKENQTIIIKKFFIGEEDMEGEISEQQYSSAEEREEWIKLRDTLWRFNVSMDGIQAFQKFRFYCQPGHLPWPLPKQDW